MTLLDEAKRENLQLNLTREEIAQNYGVTLFKVSGEGHCFLHASFNYIGMVNDLV